VDTDFLSFRGVYIDGDYIYAAAQQQGVAIFDKTNGAYVSHAVTGGEALKLVVNDGYAYVAARQADSRLWTFAM